MLFDSNVNIVVKTNEQYSVLPKCSYIEVNPVKERISIEWHNRESEVIISNIIFPNSLNKKIFLSNESDDPLFIIESIQNDNKIFYFGKLINYIKSAVQNYTLKIVLSMTNSLSNDDIKERFENMLNALTPNCKLIDSGDLINEHNTITPYNSMFNPYFSAENINDGVIHTTLAYRVVVIPIIDDIFYNAPYTTIKWQDGTTTTVKAGTDDEFNKEYGLAMAIAKKYYECLEVPNPRAAFKKAAYKDAHDQTEKTTQKRAYKEEKKKRNKRNGRISSGKKTSKR